jgi:hypothetical protein
MCDLPRRRPAGAGTKLHGRQFETMTQPRVMAQPPGRRGKWIGRRTQPREACKCLELDARERPVRRHGPQPTDRGDVRSEGSSTA